ncbi:hypothetical protein NLJ89_g7681 [Agrocybe chaxingu]|uniref:Methyltransferase domain-containing protein n=1 Tax=Agrocybe chaxingu TaxID=84603 RepID=A0A9W8JWU6_9AGAR|nr:hypothetical protein NLJ89_g7681 [Agrocybe chaxingu]
MDATDSQTLASDSNYLLAHDDEEKTRLERQHSMFKKFMNRVHGPLPASIDIGQVTNVMDVAAGTLVWTLDLASVPSVKSRVGRDVSSAIHLYACDITDQKFPPKSVIEELGINTFLHDVTAPFPDHLHSKFDLVNMKLLIFALTTNGWRKALENVRTLLKPGGKLLLCESDSVFYTKAEVSSPGFSPGQRVLNPDSWSYAYNRLFRKNALLNDHLTNLSTELPAMVEAASYTIEEKTSVVLPMGILCRTEPGACGQDVSSEEGFTKDIFFFISELITGMALNDGYLEDNDGTKIDNQEGRQRMLAALREGFVREGAFFSCTELIAQPRK